MAATQLPGPLWPLSLCYALGSILRLRARTTVDPSAFQPLPPSQISAFGAHLADTAWLSRDFPDPFGRSASVMPWDRSFDYTPTPLPPPHPSLFLRSLPLALTWLIQPGCPETSRTPLAAQPRLCPGIDPSTAARRLSLAGIYSTTRAPTTWASRMMPGGATLWRWHPR
jgi:hypothetical protein